MGIWGSAVCVDQTTLLKMIGDTGWTKRLKGFLVKTLFKLKGEKFITSPYPIFKWWNEETPDKLTDQYCLPKIELRDAGFASNLPVAPLVCPYRDIDVIVCLDASLSESKCAAELINSMEWVHKKYPGANFPTEAEVKKDGYTLSTDRTMLDKKLPAVQLLRHPSGKGPYVLYIPIAANHIPMITFEFFFEENARKELYTVVKDQLDIAKKMLVGDGSQQFPGIWNKDWAKEDTKVVKLNN